MPDRPGGFPLDEVSWGYREQFRRLLRILEERGVLGDDPARTEAVLGPLLRDGLTAGSEFVLREYLTALTRGARLLVGSPEVFERWRDLGVALTGSRAYLGRRYFQMWSAGELPGSPPEADVALRWAALLLRTDAELAFSFLQGYPHLRRHLEPERLGEFVDSGLAVHARNAVTGRAYFRMELRSAEVYAETLSRACLLGQIEGRIQRLFRAVAGRAARIGPLRLLDSDHLVERRSGVVCGGAALFLAERVACFPDAVSNRAHYLAAGLFAAACHRFGGFCTVHGERGVEAASSVLRQLGLPNVSACASLFQLAEAHRLRAAIAARYPGAVGMLREVAAADVALRRPSAAYGQAVALALGGAEPEGVSQEARRLRAFAADLCAGCTDFRGVLARMAERRSDVAAHAGRLAGTAAAAPAGFVPDHDFPLSFERAPAGTAAIDTGREPRPRGARPPQEPEDQLDPAETRTGGTGAPQDRREGEEARPVPAAFVYDEWDGTQGEYYRDWCRLVEQHPEPVARPPADTAEFRRSVEEVKRLFQRLKPDLTAREKRLPAGDRIDIDGLVRFVTMRRARLHPEDRFWIKPRLLQRDLAVALLLDVSGSTGKQSGPKDVLGLEKEAARLLAAGLDEIGDRFGIFGFTGNGRERCLFQVFKGFDAAWEREAAARLLAARPGASTRMGVALRHTGWKLSRVAAKSRLIILITDGRPMDSDYDTQTHYAHYDVRKACQENRREGIHTFCVGLDREAGDELELMFPSGSYLILDAVSELPRALTGAYLRLTKG